MLKMKPYAPPQRVATRIDSFDDDISDDVEDDVFIRDGKSSKVNEEKGLKRPLMAPRRKNHNKNCIIPNPVPIMKKHRRCWKCCEPFCYGLAAITILIVLILIAALILTLFPFPIHKIRAWLKPSDKLLFGKFNKEFYNGNEFVPCTQIGVQRIWSKVIPRLNSESPIRKADLNNDQIDDIIFGYGIDDSIQYEEIALPKCISSRPNEEVSCEGGVIALNGVNGEILWQRWTVANVFSLLCNIDIDKDGYSDCVVGGRGGLVTAINGRNGNVIWNFRELDIETNSPILIDLYTISLVRDLNNDEIPDVLAVHVEERETTRAGHIKLISGKTGKIIRSTPTPFREEVFVPLQIVVRPDGTELLMIITGGQNTPGGIYTIRLMSLMQYTSEKEFSPLFQTDFSGFMVPAILTDINGDQIEDIIVSSFNSTIYAFDGYNYTMLWNYSFPVSESVSSIVPGHFDHDNITDFMIKYNTGPGFPVYYYSQTTILSGINGQPLLDSMMTDSGGPNSLLGGVSISQTFGGDFFLHWQTQCRDKNDEKDAYEFIPESDIILQARADTCLLRYNTSTVLKLYAITRHVEPPGAVIFSTDDLGIHLNRTEYRLKTQKSSVSPLKHPKMMKKLLVKEFPVTEKQHPQQQKQLFSQSSGDVNKILKENYEKPIIETKTMNFPLQSEQEVVNPYDMKPYIYLPFNNQPGREFKDYDPVQDQQQKSQDEYDAFYNDEQQNDRPIHLRSKYPLLNNRGVRSDLNEIEITNTNSTNELMKKPNNLETKTTTAKVITNNYKNSEPFNLWDLELEKENEEALKEAHKYEYNNISDDRHKRNDVNDDESDNDNSSDGTDDGTKTTIDNNDFFISSISSTGIVLPSFNREATISTIDFAFILNIRESETYPPLFLPQDLNCVEDKMSAYRSYTSENLVNLEKQFLKQCLKARIKNITPNIPRYESQIIITRISITCSCSNLQPGEICSRFQNISEQKWTQFMGNDGNGLYV